MTQELYVGTIVQESLSDVSFLDTCITVAIQETAEVNPLERWHLYTVRCSKDQLENLSPHLKDSGWYAHFWKEGRIVVVFKERIFEFEMTDLETRQKAVVYGMSVGIPEEQLDFVIQDIF